MRDSRLFQLALLTVAAWSAAYTRLALGPLQEAIRVSFSLDDNLMAIIQGLGPALPMAVGAIPLGMLADRVSRPRFLAVVLLLAAGSFLASALAIGFGSLLAARMLAGLASAAIPIAVYSMVGDHFQAEARGRATTVVAIGEMAGSPAAFAVGGCLLVATSQAPNPLAWEATTVPWRWTLLAMGSVLILVIPMILLLKESQLIGSKSTKHGGSGRRAAWHALMAHRSIALPLQLGRASVFIADGAVVVWAAPHFAREYGMPPDKIGAALGGALLISGLAGPAIGGFLVDFCSKNAGGARGAILTLVGLALACIPAGLFPLAESSQLAIVGLATFLTLGFAIGSAALALTIIVLPGELRGLNLGISVLIGSVFFVGLAPLIVSSLSSVLGNGNGHGLGLALSLTCAGASMINALVFAVSYTSFPGRKTSRLDEAEPA